MIDWQGYFYRKPCAQWVRLLKEEHMTLEVALEQVTTDDLTWVMKNINPEVFDTHLDEFLNLLADHKKSIVAMMLPRKYLPKMRDEPNGVVRAYVAERIDPNYLPEMMNDEYYGVRLSVANRINVNYLPEMMNDENHIVRRRVADRIELKYLPEMLDDESRTVRFIAKTRMTRTLE